MLSEFEVEEASGNPYRGKGLSDAGLVAYPDLMRASIRTTTELELIASLSRDDFWHPMEVYVLKGVQRERQVNVAQAAARLGLTEFNTWYVRGLAKRLLDEGVSHCEAYRGEQPKWEHADCAAHEGKVYTVAEIYAGHRARYWPAIDESKLSIPFGPGCHHTIRRTR